MPVSRETSNWKRDWKRHLTAMLASLGLPIDETALRNLESFAEAILRENDLLHLVSQAMPEREVVKQIIDSAAISRVICFLPECRVLDVGSGAGIPGIVLKSIFPGIHLLSLDSAPKKLAFQRDFCCDSSIELDIIEGDFRRVEIPQSVDIAIVKAVGHHVDIIRRSRRWLKTGGLLLFMEGRSPNKEIDAAVNRVNGLSKLVSLPYRVEEFDSERYLTIICKK